jgi:hypothetical protein
VTLQLVPRCDLGCLIPAGQADVFTEAIHVPYTVVEVNCWCCVWRCVLPFNPRGWRSPARHLQLSGRAYLSGTSSDCDKITTTIYIWQWLWPGVCQLWENSWNLKPRFTVVRKFSCIHYYLLRNVFRLDNVTTTILMAMTMTRRTLRLPVMRKLLKS